MEQYLNKAYLLDLMEQVRVWLVSNILVWENLLQVAVGIALVPFALFIGRKVKKTTEENLAQKIPYQFKLKLIFDELILLAPYILLAFFLWSAGLILAQFKLGFALLKIFQTFLFAWIWIRLAAAIILDRFWAKVFTALALVIAVLHILGLLTPSIELLDNIGFVLGGVHLTLLSVIKAALVIFILLRFGIWISDQMEKKVATIDSLTPSAHVLLSKVIKISVVGLVCVIGLNSIGLDLSALAVFSGAIGVGIGFGLQKVVANFISGIILLMDKSIKPGDVIQMGDVYGWVTDFKGRYASVITRDGTEYLIPNEDMITQQVINWSYTNSRIRVKIPVGISYDDDVHQARKLMIEAAAEFDRVLKDPGPACLLKGFGDNSIDLELRFWIEDPQNGLANIRSEIMLNIWDSFKRHGVQIPYPQRDVHLDVNTAVKIKNELDRDGNP